MIIMLCSSSLKFFLYGYFIFYFKIEKKNTAPKKEKSENSLLHGKDKDLEVREIKSIDHFF